MRKVEGGSNCHPGLANSIAQEPLRELAVRCRHPSFRRRRYDPASRRRWGQMPLVPGWSHGSNRHLHDHRLGCHGHRDQRPA